MLDGESPTDGSSWEPTDDGSSATYAGPFGSVTVERDPWHLEFRDASGGPLTRTHHPSDSRGELNSLPIPFAFIRRSSDMHRHFAATFSLTPGERLFGGGESFTRLDVSTLLILHHSPKLVEAAFSEVQIGLRRPSP